MWFFFNDKRIISVTECIIKCLGTDIKHIARNTKSDIITLCLIMSIYRVIRKQKKKVIFIFQDKYYSTFNLALHWLIQKYRLHLFLHFQLSKKECTYGIYIQVYQNMQTSSFHALKPCDNFYRGNYLVCWNTKRCLYPI